MNMSIDAIERSIGHFTVAHMQLDSVRVLMNDRTYNYWLMSDACREAWNACNMARLDTEHDTEIEEALIPTMGNIIDGREMVNSLWAAEMPMTISAERCIIEALRSAQIVLSGIIKDLDARLLCPDFNELDEETATFLREFEL